MASRRVISASVRTAAKPRVLRPQKAPIVLTPAAVKRVNQLLEESADQTALRIGVRERGCNGLSYTLEYTQDKKKFDEEVSQDNIKIYIDSKAQLTLLGTEMDYVQTKLGSEFVFNNPNAKGTCGCGESFHI